MNTRPRMWKQIAGHAPYESTRVGFMASALSDTILIGDLTEMPFAKLNRDDVLMLDAWLQEWLLETSPTKIEQTDIDSGKIDPWNNQRDYVAELKRERMEAIGNDLISRVQRAMERGAIIMAVPFPADTGNAENAANSLPLWNDTAISGNTSPEETPAMCHFTCGCGGSNPAITCDYNECSLCFNFHA